MWNYPEGDIDAYCQKLHAVGIRNLFIQTSRSNTEDVCHPDKLGPIIDACHRYKIRVIAWSFAELVNPMGDAEKLIAAGRFTSPRGQKLDAVAANLEKDLSADKVERYSRRLREGLGKNYPMVAVVYSPLNKAPQVARIPWKLIASYYDVIAPMNYWRGKVYKQDPYAYTIATVNAVRELVQRPDVEIHVIGDGMGTRSNEIAQFFKACQQACVASASIYPNYKMTEEQMDAVSHYCDYFPVNSRFRFAAFRELLHNGSIDSPIGGDPSKDITRGNFYKLVVRQLQPGYQIDGSSLTAERAAELLNGLGVFSTARLSIPPGVSAEEALVMPVDIKEALNVVAAVANTKANSLRSLTASVHPKSGRTRGADRWFIAPAFAESGAARSDLDAKHMNYLDAAQIVLQASAALR